MGLDITAYRKLKLVENPHIEEYGEPVNWETEWRPGSSMEWSEKHFPGRGEGIDPQVVYTWEEQFRFRAGSYSGYNWWRKKLDEFAGNVAFQELINFADNEGVIGYIVASKLAKDFSDYADKAKQYSTKLDDGEYWLSKYEEWRKAFEMAADGGAVDFH